MQDMQPTQTEGKGSYNDLIGDTNERSLVPIKDSSGNLLIYAAATTSYDGSFSNYRVYAFFYERVINFKAIADLPVIDNGNDSYTVNTTDYLNHISQTYDSARYMFIDEEYFYKGKIDDNKIFNNNGSESINEDNKFMYKITALDFSKAETLFFQFRMSKAGSSYLPRFNLDPLQSGDVLFTTGTETLNDTNNKVNEDGSNVLENGVEETLFKIKSDEHDSGKGFYTILMV